MKNLAFLILVVFSLKVSAQNVSGFVVEKDTKKPMPFILVSTSGTNVFTNEAGGFTVRVRQISDTIKIKTMGYKPVVIPVTPFSGQLKLIELIPETYRLRGVTISAYKRYLQDSLDNRRIFAKQFAFKGPALTDVMHHSSTDAPFAFVNVDLLSLYKTIFKKKTKQYRLQQAMLRLEHDNHVALRFNRGLVTKVTGMKGDSLDTFMANYQPPQYLIDGMTDYNLMQYIKENYTRYKNLRGKDAPTQVDFKKGVLN
ncbi:carboxypeptidase-like regulatory domain-containing protein [Mucilaginibacter achroorhodeus]|uniref:Carboxypeptidase-like regulatory domain-containing protein n=1 Tax=Mucilaginibacter achroorhodeus TaxID=2599294 RepID=A0A563U980_9SPHI|nr:carboxypeptidase-like regulatory domain-containing protein [Mucilaginibacter achroorhodeus]TWR27905.1 carboxypeptidase-like regulatory domain-containing protein [Mucilaginibacter achroorhodeus]